MHINSVFALTCSCGSGINPDNFDNAPMFLSPPSLECTACGMQTDLMDTDAHGYDAELGHILATAPWAWQPGGVRMPEMWPALGSVCSVRIS